MDSNTSNNTQSQEIQKLIIEAGRTQLAAMSAVTKFWAGWAESADKYTQALSEELTRLSEGGTTSSDTVARATDLTREYLRELIELPSVALGRFSSEIERLSKSQSKRARHAKAKD